MTEKKQLSKYIYEEKGKIYHYCPACDELHAAAVGAPFSNGARWQFSNPEKPTLSPSMKVSTGHFVSSSRHSAGDCPMCDADGEYGTCGICHYFLKHGQLEYLSDCTHKLAGMRVPLPELPERYLK